MKGNVIILDNRIDNNTLGQKVNFFKLKFLFEICMKTIETIKLTTVFSITEIKNSFI